MVSKGVLLAGVRPKPLELLLEVVCLLPLGVLAVLSVAGDWPFPNLWPTHFRFDRWGELLGGGSPLFNSLGLSLLVSTSVAAISTALGCTTARRVAYHSRGPLLLLLAYLPFSLSPVVLGTCLLFLGIKVGLAGTTLGVIFAQTIFAYGFSVVFWCGFWNADVRAMETLVYSLGGSTLELYRRVLFPLAWGPLLLCASQTFLISWFQYGLTLLVGSGTCLTLPLRVYDYVGEANPGYAAVSACLLILPPVLVMWANRRILVKVV